MMRFYSVNHFKLEAGMLLKEPTDKIAYFNLPV